MIVKINLEDLKEQAKTRPSGYLEDVMSRGRVTDSHVIMEETEYHKLIAIYAGGSDNDIKTMLMRPGQVLSKIIYQITGKVTATCLTCSARARQMDKWGWAGCWFHRDEILGWIIEEVKKLGHPVDRHVIFSLLKAAIRETLKSRPEWPSD